MANAAAAILLEEHQFVPKALLLLTFALLHDPCHYYLFLFLASVVGYNPRIDTRTSNRPAVPTSIISVVFVRAYVNHAYLKLKSRGSYMKFYLPRHLCPNLCWSLRGRSSFQLKKHGLQGELVIHLN